VLASAVEATFVEAALADTAGLASAPSVSTVGCVLAVGGTLTMGALDAVNAVDVVAVGSVFVSLHARRPTEAHPTITATRIPTNEVCTIRAQHTSRESSSQQRYAAS